jgi:hypothetical protein
MMRGMAKKDRARAAFPSAMDAKTFIAERIAAQAEREGVALDELERKSLYFSETDEAPPDALDVASEFDEKHDAAEYEAKIAGLAKRAYRADGDDPQLHQRWLDAIARIADEDHYILVMLGHAGVLGPMSQRINLKWLVIGVAVVLGLRYGASTLSRWQAGHGDVFDWTSIWPKAIVVFVVGAIVWSMLRCVNELIDLTQ